MSIVSVRTKSSAGIEATTETARKLINGGDFMPLMKSTLCHFKLSAVDRGGGQTAVQKSDR